MTLASNGVDGRKAVGVISSSTVIAAREASFRGDPSTCVALLDGVVADEALQVEALFLRARSLLLLKRAREAVTLIEPVLSTFANVDEDCTARMLYGHAVARSEENADRGLEILTVVAEDAERRHAHRAIRAEIAYYRALAHWTKREYRESSSLATAVERAHVDVLSVRAMQLRAFITLSTVDYPAALALFRRAHDAYGSCRGRDIDLATRILVQISSLEQTLRSAAIPGTHAVHGGRTIAGSAWGPAVITPERLFLCFTDSWLFALDGEKRQAFAKMEEAEDLAPSAEWKVWALAGRAMIATVFGEHGAGWTFANKAVKLQASIDWDATTDEERIGLLQLADVFASLDSDQAARMLARYDAVTSKMDGQRVFRDRDGDPRLMAWETHTRGLVARSSGDLNRAGKLLREAADDFERIGCLWRAALALIELDATPVPTRGRLDLERAALIVRENFPRSFLARRLGRWARIYFDPVAAELSPAERDVLRYALEGLSHNQIAERTNRATSTVKKHMEQVHAAFGTTDRAQLLAECYRRGIGPPS